jgi:hypothetical protein
VRNKHPENYVIRPYLDIDPTQPNMNIVMDQNSFDKLCLRSKASEDLKKITPNTQIKEIHGLIKKFGDQGLSEYCKLAFNKVTMKL